MVENIYIRTDANSTIGTGHLVRTEILADELSKQKKKITFICKDIPKHFREQLEQKSYNVLITDNKGTELKQLLRIIDQDKSLLIIDSDNNEFYTKRFQTGIKQEGIKLLMITFFNQYHFYADIVLNQNIMALSQEYSCEAYTKLLLGPQNVILKDEYRKIHKELDKHKSNKPQKTVLITFGGVDAPDRTSMVYRALLNTKSKPGKIIIVLGAMYSNTGEIEDLSKDSNINTQIYRNTPKMPYLLAESDIVFTSGGLTVWEAGVFKDLIIVLAYSEREKTGGRYLGENDYGIYLGTKDDYTTETLSERIDTILSTDNSEMINKLSHSIDVNGIHNIADAINELK